MRINRFGVRGPASNSVCMRREDLRSPVHDFRPFSEQTDFGQVIFRKEVIEGKLSVIDEDWKIF